MSKLAAAERFLQAMLTAARHVATEAGACFPAFAPVAAEFARRVDRILGATPRVTYERPRPVRAADRPN